MLIEVKRKWFSPEATIGEMYIGGSFVCFTLEDTVRDTKVFGETAIPYGTYEVKITHSPHFNRDLPLLLNVPNYDGVRIHSGNTAADTEGCILVGTERKFDEVDNSRVAFNKVFPLIKDAIDQGDTVWVSLTKEDVLTDTDNSNADSA